MEIDLLVSKKGAKNWAPFSVAYNGKKHASKPRHFFCPVENVLRHLLVIFLLHVDGCGPRRRW